MEFHIRKSQVVVLSLLIALVFSTVLVHKFTRLCEVPTYAVSGVDGLFIYENGELNRVVSGYMVESIDWSPDGSKIAYSIRTQYGGSTLSVYDIETRTTYEISLDSSVWNVNPVWSPDGRSIAFTRDDSPNRAVSGDVYLWIAEHADNIESDRVNALVQRDILVQQYSWSAVTGELFYASTVSGNAEIYRYQRGPIRYNLLVEQRDGYYDYNPAVSPDGNYVAWMSSNHLATRRVDNIGGLTTFWSNATTQVPLVYWTPSGDVAYTTIDSVVVLARKEGVELGRWPGGDPSWSPDETFLATKVDDDTYTFYDLVNGTECVDSLPGGWLTFQP